MHGACMCAAPWRDANIGNLRCCCWGLNQLILRIYFISRLCDFQENERHDASPFSSKMRTWASMIGSGRPEASPCPRHFPVRE
eukprot:scaffold27984_cov113-Isochrysis_galbana.AAC.8